MKFLILAIFVSAISACSLVQKIPVPMPRSQVEHRFIEALDEFSETNRVVLLKQLQRDYPDSVWRTRAQTIILYAQELDNRKRQIEILRKDKEQQAADIAELQKENQELTEKLEQLKGVLIEVENQPQ